MNDVSIYFYLQLAGFVIVGSLVGEFLRYSRRSINMTKFIANFLASCFLSFAVAFLFRYITNNIPLSYGIGSLLAYQDEKYLNRISKRLLVSIIKNLDLLEDENDKKK